MNIFFKKDFPFFFTLVMGFVFYHINSIISNHTDTPLLAYKFREVSEKNVKGNIQRKLECELINYSRKNALKDIKIHIAYRTDLPKPRKVFEANIVAVAPSAILADSMTQEARGNLNEYKIPMIHPRAKYILKLTALTNPKIHENPNLYLYSDESIRLTSHNFETFLIRNQDTVNFILLIIWIAVAILYLYIIQKRQQKNESKT